MFLLRKEDASVSFCSDTLKKSRAYVRAAVPENCHHCTPQQRQTCTRTTPHCVCPECIAAETERRVPAIKTAHTHSHKAKIDKQRRRKDPVAVSAPLTAAA